MDRTVRLAITSNIFRMAVINAAFAIETFLEGTRTDEAGLAEMMHKGIFCSPVSLLVVHWPLSMWSFEISAAILGMLAVSPAGQGKGLGKAMVAAEHSCRQHGRTAIDITVLRPRPELPAFYSRLGTHTEVETTSTLHAR